MDVFAFGRSWKTSKDVFDCSAVFPARMGGGFATVKAVVEHKGVADAGLGFRVQLAADQPIASADSGALKSAMQSPATGSPRSSPSAAKMVSPSLASTGNWKSCGGC